MTNSGRGGRTAADGRFRPAARLRICVRVRRTHLAAQASPHREARGLTGRVMRRLEMTYPNIVLFCGLAETPIM
jgi:hypothetical protein